MFAWLGQDSVNRQFDTVGKVAQILALVVAGYWAYRTNKLTVQPGLEFRGKVTNSLEWSRSADPEHCYLTMKVSVENQGLSSFEVSSMHVQGWIYPSSTGSTFKDPVHVDYQAISKQKAFFDETYPPEDKTNPKNKTPPKFDPDTPAALLSKYPPGMSSEQAWDWVFQRKQKENRAVLLRVATETKDSKVAIPTAWQSEEVCSIKDDDANDTQGLKALKPSKAHDRAKGAPTGMADQRQKSALP